MEFDANKSANKVIEIDSAHECPRQQLCVLGMHQPSADEVESGAEFAAAGGLGPHDAIARRRARVWSLLMLLQPQWFMSGLWSEVKGGFRDSRTEKTFGFDECESLIDVRIEELGVAKHLVEAYPGSVWNSMDAAQHFQRLPFDEQMERFIK